jgi:tetratricopeptide (TPR) repeat protein
VGWGLGWAVEEDGGARRVWHHGDNSNSGFTAFVMADPGTRSGVVYFANSTTGLGIVAEVLDRLRLFGDAVHPSVRWIDYERYDAPSRAVRLAVERQVRVAGAEAGLRVYQELKGRYPRGAFGESLLNSLGYRFLSMRQAADAISLFRQNVAEYPASSNVYDSLGEAYAAAGDREQAIRNYRRTRCR